MKEHMKISGIVAVCLLLLISNIWIGCDSPKNQEDSTPAMATELVASEALSVDPEAVKLLRRGLDFLSNLDEFSVQTQSTYEDILNGVYRVDYETSGSISVNRPNKIHIERYGLKMHQIFYYDGEDFTLHNPYDNVYAIETVRGNIEDMFHIARDTFGISGPSSDLIYSNSFSLLIQDVNGASVIGKEIIGDVTCDHLLFSRPDVSYQIWISDKEPFLPYKYVVTDISTPQLLSYTTNIKNWDTATDLPESMFKFTPPEGSKNIMFLKVDQNNEQ